MFAAKAGSYIYTPAHLVFKFIKAHSKHLFHSPRTQGVGK